MRQRQPGQQRRPHQRRRELARQARRQRYNPVRRRELGHGAERPPRDTEIDALATGRMADAIHPADHRQRERAAGVHPGGGLSVDCMDGGGTHPHQPLAVRGVGVGEGLEARNIAQAVQNHGLHRKTPSWNVHRTGKANLSVDDGREHSSPGM
ncbi:hypothetical protein D3C86_1480120 [compost metagenome]